MRNMRKSVFILTLAAVTGLFFPGRVIYAQAAEDIAEKQSDSRVFFTIGGNWLDLDKLNSTLANNGYSRLPESFFSIGFCNYQVWKGSRFLYGGEGQLLFGEQVEKGEFRTSILGSYGLFNFGYLLNSGDWNIYPHVGIGGGGSRLRITETGKLSFRDILDNPRRESSLLNAYFMLNVGIGADYIFLKPIKDKKKKFGFGFGVRLGYTFAPWISDWHLDKEKLYGGPETGITGPYIRFMFGQGLTKY